MENPPIVEVFESEFETSKEILDSGCLDGNKNRDRCALSLTLIK